MRVRLIPKNIIENSYTEEELKDLSILESFYVMRKLKAVIKSVENSSIGVTEPNDNGQVFSSEFMIWFNQNEYEIIVNLK